MGIGTAGLSLKRALARSNNGMGMLAQWFDVGHSTEDMVENWRKCLSMLYLMRIISDIK